MMTKSLCKTALILTFIVITLGALTRLLDAGLACPDWPGCYGQLLPSDNLQFSHDSQLDQSKLWMEMIHRYLAATLGLLILIIAVLIEKNKSLTNAIKWLSRSILLLVIIQALFGMLTVVMKLLPQVVSLHLLSGMLLLSLLFILLLNLSAHPHRPKLQPLRPYAISVVILLCCQISLGVWTSSNYAGMACPDFPTCQNQWLPELTLKQSFDITALSEQNYQGGLLAAQHRVTIQVVHRLVAILLLVSVLSLFYRLWQSQLKVQASLLLGLTLLQISLGIANAVLMLPVPLALAHNSGAALLLLSVVYINFLVLPKQNSTETNHRHYTHQPIT